MYEYVKRIMMYSSILCYQRFEGKYCIHLRDNLNISLYVNHKWVHE
jgi:hypothetical protein